MFLKFFILAATFLLSCADVERDSLYDSEGINYGGKDLVEAPGKGNDIANYRTVRIGEQVWMAENLDYRVPFSRCYDNIASNCGAYGRLYDWATAMALPAMCNFIVCISQISAKHRGICPEGWHIPSREDWSELLFHVDSENGGDGYYYDEYYAYDSYTAGRYLKANSGWLENGNGEDKYEFSALPGGGGEWNGSDLWDFNYGGRYGVWWSSSEYDDSGVARLSMPYNSEYAYYTNDGKPHLYSVRCLQD